MDVPPRTDTLTDRLLSACLCCPPGPCSGECQSKRSHNDEDEDDEARRDGAAGQAVKAAEERRPSRRESGAEVQ